MNGYQKSQSLSLTGTDAEIVAKLQTLTAGPIPIANVLQWFDEQNLAELDPIENAWVGTLVSVVKNPATPAPLAAGLRRLFVHLAKRTSQTVDTTDLTFAVEVWTLLGYLIQMGVVTSQQRDSFYLLDGGRPYKDLTVQQFAAQRADAEAEQVRQSIRLRLDAAWNQIGTSEQADAIAELRAIADEMEA
jgi:hypothetical protein